MLGLWNIENIDVPLKHQEIKVLSHLTAISVPPKTSFYFFSFIESRIPPLAPNPDLLFYCIWVGKHVLWLSECCFHLQFYFVLQNHSGILLDPKAIVWEHFSKACKKKDICSSVIHFLLSFFLFLPWLCWWPLICPFESKEKPAFLFSEKASVIFCPLQDATCAIAFLPRGLKSPQQCLLPSRSQRLLCSKTLEQTLKVKPLHSLIEGGEEVWMYLEMHRIFA